MSDKAINVEDLKKRFTDLNLNMEITKNNITKLQNALNQEQSKFQQFLGAMQNTGELMVTIVGPEEAQKIINEIQNPKKEEVKEDGKKG